MTGPHIWFLAARAWILARVIRALVLFFRLFTATGDFQRRHPKGFDQCVTLAAFILALILWRYVEPYLGAVKQNSTWSYLAHEALRGLCGVLLMVGVWLFFFGLLPLLAYTPDALAMRSLGLARCATGPGAMDKILRAMANKHPKDNPIKIICISGVFLFREDEGEKPPPLWDWANRAKLDVVLPLTGVCNSTIQSRWDGYSTEFRDTKYPAIGDLEREVAESRAFLQNKCNTVTSHNLLCMWQVVLFDEFCVVQNYFPNASGRSINRAPVFLFERSEGSKNSYYAAFAEMFRLAKHVSSKPTEAASGQTPAQGTAAPTAETIQPPPQC